MNDMDNNNELRKILADTKVKASENLKYRIMQQIQTESALKRQVNYKSSKPMLRNVIGIYIVMYILIVLAGVGFYFFTGEKTTHVTYFYILIFFVAFVSLAFTLISFLDERHKFKKKNGN